MSIETQDDRERRRHRRKRSITKRIGEKLISKKFNIYQAVMAIMVACIAYKMISYFFDTSPSPPADTAVQQ